jgi:hypothetical protein
MGPKNLKKFLNYLDPGYHLYKGLDPEEGKITDGLLGVSQMGVYTLGVIAVGVYTSSLTIACLSFLIPIETVSSAALREKRSYPKLDKF